MAISPMDLLGARYHKATTDRTRRRILEQVACEMLETIKTECRIGALRGYGKGNAISALGVCIQRGCATWNPKEASLTTWLVLLTSQECSKWFERKEKFDHPATASNQMNTRFWDEAGESVEIDRLDEVAHTDLDPYALDNVIYQCDAQEDEAGMLMQAYALCYRDGVTSEIANLSARSGLSFAKISEICRSGVLEARIRDIHL